MNLRALDGHGYAKFLTAGACFLRRYRQVLNALNVFPVPDGDTGTNLYLTARHAAVEAGKTHETLAAAAAAAAHGALMGARGNSGIILSQMLRGFANAVAGHVEIDTRIAAAAMRAGVAAAKQALAVPVAGTAISVAEAAVEAAESIAHREPDFYRFLNGVLEAANEALDRTPDQLPVLKQAGVVDAGGAGLVYLLEGILRFLPDGPTRETAFPRRPAHGSAFSASKDVGPLKYCTEFFLASPTVSTAQMRELLHANGDSVIVAEAPPFLKVHLHTGEPERVQALAGRHGALSRVKVENMEEQHRDLVAEVPAAYAIVAAVPGAGFERIWRELGAQTVMSADEAGVEDWALALNRCRAQTVYAFPNDGSLVPAAQQAARLSGRTVHVVPAADPVAGIAGLFALRSTPEGAPPKTAAVLKAAATSGVRVFFAGNDDSVGGTVARGTPAAMSADVFYAGSSLAGAAIAALTAEGAHDGGLITVYYGGSQNEHDVQRFSDDLRAAFPRADVEYYYGGQKAIEYWISLDE